MKWYGITGSWRYEFDPLKNDVEQTIKKIVLQGDGIVTGGAMGVDYFATQTFLVNAKKEEISKKLKIYLPVCLKDYLDYLYKRVEQGAVTKEKVDLLEKQLNFIKENFPQCIMDDSDFNEVNTESYFARNEKIVDDCDEIYAFHVNNTKGVQDAINHATKSGKPVHVKKYSIEID